MEVIKLKLEMLNADAMIVDDNKEIRRVISTNLKRLRENNEMSREDVAEKIGVSPYTVINYENGQKTPKVTSLNKYADCFNISLDEIFGRGDFLVKIILAYRVRIAQLRISDYVKCTDSHGVDGMIYIDYSDAKDFFERAKKITVDNQNNIDTAQEEPNVALQFSYSNFAMFYDNLIFRATCLNKTFEELLYDKLQSLFSS